MNWSDDKARLNHDVLSNQVENELVALEGHPGGDSRRLSQFILREPEFRQLLKQAPEALSTAAVLDWPMFNSWDDCFRKEMKEIAHAIFTETSGIRKKTAELGILLDQCLAAAREFLNRSNDQRTAEQVSRLRQCIEKLRSGISSLPRSY